MKTAAFIMALLVSTSIFAQSAKKGLVSNTNGPVIVSVEDDPGGGGTPTPPPPGGGTPGGGGGGGRS